MVSAAAKRRSGQNARVFSKRRSSNPRETETRPATAGRDGKVQKDFVYPPVFQGSTVLHPTAQDLRTDLERRFAVLMTNAKAQLLQTISAAPRAAAPCFASSAT